MAGRAEGAARQHHTASKASSLQRQDGKAGEMGPRAAGRREMEFARKLMR